MIKENREPRFYYSKKDESNFVNMILSNKFQNSPQRTTFRESGFPKRFTSTKYDIFYTIFFKFGQNLQKLVAVKNFSHVIFPHALSSLQFKMAYCSVF